MGASQGAGCFGAAYEYLFNVSYWLCKAGLSNRVKLTYVSAEPSVVRRASTACSSPDRRPTP